MYYKQKLSYSLAGSNNTFLFYTASGATYFWLFYKSILRSTGIAASKIAEAEFSQDLFFQKHLDLHYTAIGLN